MTKKCKHLETVSVVKELNLMTQIAEVEETCKKCGKVVKIRKLSGVEWINHEEILDTIADRYK